MIRTKVYLYAVVVPSAFLPEAIFGCTKQECDVYSISSKYALQELYRKQCYIMHENPSAVLEAPLAAFSRLGTNVGQAILAHCSFHLAPHFLNLVLLFGHQSLLRLQAVREFGSL